jgi:penicillin amidase/acyl-homoserine-lactone acylase
MENNRKVATHGDCYFQMVDWDKEGNLTAESIHQYGSATLDDRSVHFNDQSELFSTMKMKPSFLKLEDFKTEIKSSYRP